MERRDFLQTALSLLPFAAFGGFLARDKKTALSESVRTNGKRAYLLPPGAQKTEEFLNRCIRCHRCGEACPNSTISFLNRPDRPSIHGIPVIQPREKGCIVCMKCGQVCPTGAIMPAPDDSTASVQANVSMGAAAVDEKTCFSYNSYSCGVCVEACPFKGMALKSGLWERPTVDPAYCVGCGLCEQACIHYPQAIRVKPNPERMVIA